jgi:uncharacterized protein (DUF1330 family)
MPKGYILALVSVADEVAYRASGYMAMAEAAIAAHGRRFLVRGGSPTPLEGAAITQRIVILEFPSRDIAKAFYRSEDYAPAITLRQSLSEGSLVLLDEYISG